VYTSATTVQETCGRIHVLDVAKKRGSWRQRPSRRDAGRLAESDLPSIGVLRSLRSPLMGGVRQESDFRVLRAEAEQQEVTSRPLSINVFNVPIRFWLHTALFGQAQNIYKMLPHLFRI
jgi:hypothetical protein